MKKINKKLGEILLETGLIDDFQLNASLKYQSDWGGKLGTIIINKGFVRGMDLMSVLEKQFGLACVSIDSYGKPSPEVLKMVQPEAAKKFGIFPLSLEGKTLVIAISDPTDLKVLDDISFKLGVRVKPLLALESDIIRAIGMNYEGKSVERIAIDSAVLTGNDGRVLHEERAEVAVRGKAPENERTDHAELKTPDISQKAMLEGVIDLLVAKGIFTREELTRKLNVVRQSQEDRL